MVYYDWLTMPKHCHHWALAAAIVHCVPVCDRFSKLAMKIGPKPGT